MKNIYDKLVEQFGTNNVCIKKRGSRAELLWTEFIQAAITLETSNLYTFCGFSSLDSFSKYFTREYKGIVVAKQGRTWKSYLLSLVELKHCPSCKIVKSIDEFNKSSCKIDSLTTKCKECEK